MALGVRYLIEINQIQPLWQLSFEEKSPSFSHTYGENDIAVIFSEKKH